MTVIPLPARSPRRYGEPVVTHPMAFEDEQDERILALATRLVSGDESALEEIYDRWSALVHTYALRAVHDPHDAEDVTQQVFVAAWRSRHTLTPSPVALPAWLLGIARHKVADVRAARARDADRVAAVVSISGVHDGSDQSVDDEVAERLVVRQAVDELPEPRRTIMSLAFWEERSHAEIAETVGLPLGTVKSHVRRGLIKLHQQLEGCAMDHADPEDLAGLALDPTDCPDDVSEHAAACPECAALVAVFAGVRRRAGGEALVDPPARVRSQVLAEVRGADVPAPVPLPAHERQRPRRGIPLWLASVAAALALLAGVGLGWWGADRTEAPEAAPAPDERGTVVAAATLTALDSDADRGRASAVRSEDTFTIRVSATQLGDEPGVREVWLINVDGVRMVSIGLLAAGDDGEFAVPMELIDQGYRIVDISIEPTDGDPTHSGVSLARGELA